MYNRRVIVMSGVSGSGKSTFIKNMMAPRETTLGNLVIPSPYRIVSADQYFIRDGEYYFDPSKIGQAHAQCFAKFIEAMISHDDNPLIFVDNTNTTNEEIAPYMLGAAAFGYEAEIITMAMPREYNNSSEYISQCSARNSHGASEEEVIKQAGRIANRILPPYWKNTNIESSF